MLRQISMFITGLLMFCTAGMALADDISSIEIETSQNQTLLRVKIAGSEKPNVFTIAEGIPRVVIDIKEGALTSELKSKAVENSYFAGGGGIEKVRYAQYNTHMIRLVADLKPGASFESSSFVGETLSVVLNTVPTATIENAERFEVPVPNIKTVSDENAASEPVKEPEQVIEAEIVVADPIPTVTLEPEPVEEQPAQYVENIPVPTLKDKTLVRKYRKPVIVIDPGHGGYDPGAIGQKKVKEENVTLAAALELKRQLVATGKYSVVLTREKVVYVDHEERVRIARKAGANLFISIHADSTSSSATRGASVYTLADRAHKRSQTIIDSQNWILDVDLADQSEQVGDILVDLAQRKTLTKSSQFADMMIPELAKNSALVGNTHRRAGLYVLLAPDVPAVLLEMGFLSNEKDERLLNSEHHRKNLMKSVTRSINVYFKTQTQLQASR
jgi:N-acetylmuramoyl-L-alanine amidase